jgi:excisionase family DNA binding protein
MLPVLTLDELAANPERASEIAPNAAAVLLGRLAGLQTVLLARLLAPAGNGTPDGAPPEKLLTIKEAAALLAIPPAFAYELARRGEIPTVRVGRKYIRVPLRPLQRLLDGGLSTLYKRSRRTLTDAHDRGRTPRDPHQARLDAGRNG